MNLYHSLQNLTNWNDFESSQSNFNKKQQGTRFELLTKELFTWHPLYRGWIRNAWLSTELPIWVQKTLNLKSDIGFDLILEDNEGSLIPVQCKYHSDPNRNVGWKEASTFVGLYNDKKDCQEAFLCSNAFGVSKNFDSLQGKPINRILGSQWLKLDESFFSSIGNNDTKKLDPYIPLNHQEKAIRDAKSYFLKGGKTRGKLIFPCGSGKSLTGFWFTQHLGAQTTLIAVPSLALVKQTLEVYFREITAQNLEVKWLCVCSDHDIGAGVSEVKFSTHDIGIPSTTDSVKIKHWLKRTQGDKRYVFTTYQSGQRLAHICKETGTQFDLGIFDEAHKTVGAKDKLFSHLLFHHNIKIERRIFMTATERFYTGSKDDIASMDNEEIYGEVFSKMSFKDAIATKLLTDYKIITIDVAKEEIASFIRKNKLVELNPKYGKETEARSLASMFALRKAMQKLPIKNAVSFHSSIDKARRAESIQELLSKEFGFEEIDTFTVNGKDSVGKREKIINEFASSDNALITNARCLTEGVDVPKIDCIVFSDPKRSKVDIVQALGRALRKKKGKEWGYVILPVVYDNRTHQIDNDSFKDILGIVRGLAANDERIVEFFRESMGSSSRKDSFESVIEMSYLKESISPHLLKSINVKIWEGLSRFSWLPFDQAKQLIHQEKFSSVREFEKNRKRLSTLGIPGSPNQIYLNDGWTSWGDFLGNGNIHFSKKERLRYQEAKELIRSLGISSLNDYLNIKEKSQLGLPSNLKPYYQYQKEWVSYRDFFGVNYRGIEILSFNAARKLVQELNIRKIKDYRNLGMDFFRSKGLPSNPDKKYQAEGWNGWSDFFGVEKFNSEIEFLSFEEARKIVHQQKFNSRTEWNTWSKTHRPQSIPSVPQNTYRENGWISWNDWLNIELIATQKIKFLPFHEARQLVRGLNLNTQGEYKNYVRAKSDSMLPSNPSRTYKNSGWESWGDWLGTNRIATFNRYESLTYEEAREYVISLGVRNEHEWKSIHNLESKLPLDLRTRFSEHWSGWKNFLGDKYQSNKSKNSDFLDFKVAKALVHSYQLKSINDWRKFVSSGSKPENIPKYPDRYYSQWKGFHDWLGIQLSPTTGKIKWRSFDSARKWVRKQNLKSNKEWRLFIKSGKLPLDIPKSPDRLYKQNWKSWADWLGKKTN